MKPPTPSRDFLRALLAPWTWRMAWRDSRTSRRRLALFSCSIVLGIAALTAIGSFGSNLERAIEEQSKSLLGADLIVSARRPLTTNDEQLISDLGGEQSREDSFPTMIYFVRGDGTRLVQVRALSGNFPYYGQLETDPPAAAEEFRQGGGVLVEDSLLTQFNASIGDSIRLGALTTRIVGRLKKVPGENLVFATLAPRVYLPMTDLPKTGLVREGSLVRYRVYFKFPDGTDVTQLVKQNRPRLDKLLLAHETVADRKHDLGRALGNLYHFLNLVGFIALLLGGVGVASAIHVHVKQKLGTVAILRCLGGSIAQTFAIYLAQGMALGLFGASLGAALGVAIQSALPRLLMDFIPFTFQFRTSWPAVAMAVTVGFVICLLFAVLPLLAVRRVSPLAALRVSFESAPAQRDPLRWLVGAGLALCIIGFALKQGHDWRIGLGFVGGLALTGELLAATAKGLITLTRKLSSAIRSFVWRQGLANLHRPNNRTLSLLLSLGLGTFLMVCLVLVQQTLLVQLTASGGKNQANAILFDVQPDQRAPLAQLVRSLNLPVLDEAPIVTMRLISIKGRPVESLLADKQSHTPGWMLRREYRCTYNDHLRDSERIVAGKWIGQVSSDTTNVPISMEADIAKDLHVGLGDEIVFDVQGVPLTTRVASLREVDWERIQPNFFVVFPRGVLEGAPTMHVLVSRVANSDESARLQREVMKVFPNVTTIDLTLVLQTLDSVLSKISFVIRFMGMFTVLTGLFVLVGALATSRYQRIEESVLLRTLGASRRQIFRILAVEYFSLGALAALTGVLLAVVTAWILTRFVFHERFALTVLPLAAALVIVPVLTIVTGLFMSRGVLDQPPLVILRGV